MYQQIPKDFIQQVKIKLLYSDVKIPQYVHEGDAGFDLVAHNFIEHHSFRMNTTPFKEKINPEAKSILLIPHARLLVGCGFALEIPKGLQLEIRGRSGNALNRGIVLAHGVGTIDSSYRGQISFLVLNTSDFAEDVGDAATDNFLQRLKLWQHIAIKAVGMLASGIWLWVCLKKEKENLVI